MNEPTERFDAPPDRFDTVIEVLLALLLVFSPLALGAVDAWSELVVVVLASAMAICLALKFVFCPDERPVLSWAYLPLGLFLLLALFQLLPLPDSILGLLSPQTAAIKRELLADLAQAAPGTDTPTALAISFYAHGTLHDLRLLLAVVAVFLAAVHVYRRPEAIRRLLSVVAVLGASLALLAIAQIVTGTHKIYWLLPDSRGGVVRGGPFVNRNNFCLFMNLSLGASLALLLLKITDGLRDIPKTLPNVLDWITSPRARWVWLLFGAIVVGMASVFLSLSRGGVIALLFAAAFTALVMSIRRKLDGRAWIMVCLTLAAFVCVLFLGFDAVYDRLATLEKEHAYTDRWELARNAATAWTRFPVAGAGLGTHEVVFPMFNRATGPALFEYVENEYAQLAEETGILGLLLVAAFLAIVGVSYRRCLKGGGWQTAVAYGLGFSLIAAMVHSVGDFGLHLPANACLAAAFAGVLVGVGSLSRERASARDPAHALSPTGPGSLRTRMLAPLGLLVTVLVFGWALYSANNAREAERHWNRALELETWLEERDWNAGNQVYADLIRQAAEAVDFDPENVHYRYWLAVYRWRSISRVVDMKTRQIVLSPKNLESLHRIVCDLHEVRPVCPTFGPIYCVAGQLEKFFLKNDTGGAHIQTGYSLAPSDPTVCFVAGLLDTVEGRPDEAVAKFQRAFSLDGRLFTQIANVLIQRLKKPEMALEMAGDDMRRLAQVAHALEGSKEYPELAKTAQARADAALKRDCEEPDASASLLAQAGAYYQKQKDFDAAVTYYRRALALDYGQVGWHYQLALVYASLEQYDKAMDEARICLRLRPQMKAAEKLIRDLSTTKPK